VRRQATTDELTNLVNRRRFIEALETELERAKMFDSPLSVVLADLDDFKRINDDHGHHGGDRVLKSFGQLLRAQVRDFDVAARLGARSSRSCSLRRQPRLRRSSQPGPATPGRVPDGGLGRCDCSAERQLRHRRVEPGADNRRAPPPRRRRAVCAKRAGKNRYVVDATAGVS
jgi:hypothetical protein